MAFNKQEQKIYDHLNTLIKDYGEQQDHWNRSRAYNRIESYLESLSEENHSVMLIDVAHELGESRIGFIKVDNIIIKTNEIDRNVLIGLKEFDDGEVSERYSFTFDTLLRSGNMYDILNNLKKYERNWVVDKKWRCSSVR